MAVSTLGLAWFDSVLWMSASLFLLGLGWNISYVAAVTELADRALPAERGKLIGLTDQLSSFTGAALVLLGGARLQRVRRRGAGARRDGLRRPARGLDSATIRRRRTRCAPSFCEMKTC